MVTMNRLCPVVDCNQVLPHTYAGHQCDSCGFYGHDISECGDVELTKGRRDQHKSDRLPHNLVCQVDACAMPWSHTTRGHICTYCRMRQQEHSRTTCPEWLRLIEKWRPVLDSPLNSQHRHMLLLGLMCAPIHTTNTTAPTTN